MGTSKVWSGGIGTYTYSDKTGAYKYTEAGITFNYAYESAQPTVNQYSFRFINDDGSESTSTFKAALNTAISLDKDTVTRIRFLVDTRAFSGQKTFKLKFRRKPLGGPFGPWENIT